MLPADDSSHREHSVSKISYLGAGEKVKRPKKKRQRCDAFKIYFVSMEVHVHGEIKDGFKYLAL